MNGRAVDWKAVDKKGLLIIMIVLVSSLISAMSLFQVYSLKSENIRLQESNDVLRKGYVSLNINHSNLQTKYSDLQAEYSEVENAYLELQNNYAELQNDYSLLETDYFSLSMNYSNLQTLYAEFETAYPELQNNYTELQNNYSTLETDYNTLAIDYSSLSTDYSNLQIEYAEFETAYPELQNNYTELQNNYNMLETEYSSLNSDYVAYVSFYQELRNQVNQRIGWTSSPTSFITPEDLTVVEIVNNITGGWNDPSDLDEFWRDIKELYLWVRDDVEYRSDELYPLLPYIPSDDLEFCKAMWQFSNETLDLKQGNSEDQAILLCSMINFFSNQSIADAILISGSNSTHLAVQLLVSENMLVILDPTGNYYSHNYVGDINPNDIDSEINEWRNYWKPSLGEDTYIRRVFSEHFIMNFSETSEYLDWMYDRDQ